MGDLSGLETTEDITERYEQHFDKNNYAKGQEVGIIRRFLKEAQVGDYVIFAEPSEFHIGKIESDYYYDDTDNPWQDSDYKNSRKVMWLKKHIDRSILSTALHHSLSTAMSFFGINDYRAAVVDLLRGTYKKDEETSTIESTDLIFSDVTKQYLYQLVYNKFLEDHGVTHICNCFLMPTDEDGTNAIPKGQARMEVMNKLGLTNIQIRLLPAIDMYRHYLKGTHKEIVDLELPNLEI